MHQGTCLGKTMWEVASSVSISLNNPLILLTFFKIQTRCTCVFDYCCDVPLQHQANWRSPNAVCSCRMYQHSPKITGSEICLWCTKECCKPAQRKHFIPHLKEVVSDVTAASHSDDFPKNIKDVNLAFLLTHHKCQESLQAKQSPSLFGHAVEAGFYLSLFFF